MNQGLGLSEQQDALAEQWVRAFLAPETLAADQAAVVASEQKRPKRMVAPVAFLVAVGSLAAYGNPRSVSPESQTPAPLTAGSGFGDGFAVLQGIRSVSHNETTGAADSEPDYSKAKDFTPQINNIIRYEDQTVGNEIGPEIEASSVDEALAAIYDRSSHSGTALAGFRATYRLDAINSDSELSAKAKHYESNEADWKKDGQELVDFLEERKANGAHRLVQKTGTYKTVYAANDGTINGTTDGMPDYVFGYEKTVSESTQFLETDMPDGDTVHAKTKCGGQVAEFETPEEEEKPQRPKESPSPSPSPTPPKPSPSPSPTPPKPSPSPSPTPPKPSPSPSPSPTPSPTPTPSLPVKSPSPLPTTTEFPDNEPGDPGENPNVPDESDTGQDEDGFLPGDNPNEEQPGEQPPSGEENPELPPAEEPGDPINDEEDPGDGNVPLPGVIAGISPVALGEFIRRRRRYVSAPNGLRPLALEIEEKEQ